MVQRWVVKRRYINSSTQQYIYPLFSIHSSPERCCKLYGFVQILGHVASSSRSNCFPCPCLPLPTVWAIPSGSPVYLPSLALPCPVPHLHPLVLGLLLLHYISSCIHRKWTFSLPCLCLHLGPPSYRDRLAANHYADRYANGIWRDWEWIKLNWYLEYINCFLNCWKHFEYCKYTTQQNRSRCIFSIF